MELEPNIENGKNPRMLWQHFCMISFSRIRIILIKCIDNYTKSIHINVTINQCAIRTTLIWCSTYIKYWQVSHWKEKENLFTFVCFSVSLFCSLRTKMVPCVALPRHWSWLYLMFSLRFQIPFWRFLQQNKNCLSCEPTSPSRLPCYVSFICMLTNKNPNIEKLGWAIN